MNGGVSAEMYAARLRAGVSMEVAAAAAEISPEAYRKREEGVAIAAGAELALLARFYGRRLREAFPSYVPTEGERLWGEEFCSSEPTEH